MLLKNHPRGLLVLFFTEMWERFGFYTMMAIFVLYMDEKLGWGDARKGDFYGWFLLAVYFIPILGGWLGDQVLGRKPTIRVGAVSMVVGYLALALSSPDWLAPFYLGLVLVAFGTGLFKANISVLVGQLYPEGSPLKDSAFNIFYMGVNLGATFSPLAATWIHNQFGSYNLSFAAAAAGMVVSMVIFQWGRRHLVPAHPGASPGEVAGPEGGKTAPWKAEDWQRVVTLAVLFLIAIFFWVGFYQNGFALTLFAQRSTLVYRLLKPETYQFFGPFFILVLTPPLVWLFGKLRAHGGEPSSASKIATGLFISGLSLLVMVAAGMLGGDRDQAIMSPWWLVSSYFLMSLGEILFSPMGLSFVSKVAPARIRGLMMGFWFSATAAGGYSSGVLGRLYGEMPHHLYFLLIAALLLVGAALALVFRRRLDRFTA
jgi:POT family proton-dependent oligopeptide transporter